MGKTLLLSPHESDVAAMVASNAVGGAGVTNLQNQKPTLVWQSTTSSPHVVIDVNGSRLWNAIFFGYINAQIGDSVRIRGATSEEDLTLSPFYDSAISSPTGILLAPPNNELGVESQYRYPHALVVTNLTESLSWWRIDFSWMGNLDGYVRCGRLALGRALVPAETAAADWETSHLESVVETEDIGGGLSTRIRGVRRSVSFGWDPVGLSADEGAAIQEMMLRRGSSRDLIACVDTDEVHTPTTNMRNPMRSLYVGRVKQSVVIKHIPVSYRTTNLTIEELGVTEMR